MSLEIRTAVNGNIKDADETKREVLVSIPADVRDSYDTTFAADCFRDSFAKRMPAIVWQHQMNEPIGRTISAQVTGTSNELVGKFSDFDAVPLARRAFSQLADGSLTDVSFGFQRQSDEKHPEMRGVTRITKALMQEWSPVTIGAIPGAVVTGTRAEEYDKDGIAIPSLDEIMQLQAAGLLDRDEARAMLAKLPEWRQHIILLPAAPVVEERQPDPTDTPAAGAVTPVETTKPVVATDTVTDAEARSDEDVEDAATLAAATAAAVREALRYFGECSEDEMRGLSDNARQAIALMQAGSVTVTDLLEVLGVPDDSEARSETETSEQETAQGAGAAGTEARVGPKGYIHGWIKADGDTAALHDAAMKRGSGRHAAVGKLLEHVQGKVDEMEDSRERGRKLDAHKSAMSDLDKADELSRDAENDDAVDSLLSHVKSKLTNPAARSEAETAEIRAAMSDTAWSKFSQSDFTPAQWKSACLIWDGPADEMSSGKLPVKEPDGTPNTNAMAAAAGRLGQTDAPDALKKSAAKTLLAMYGAAKMKAPGSLLAACREVDDEDAEIRAMVLEADLDSLDDIFGKYAA